jgi:hypothetical protein
MNREIKFRVWDAKAKFMCDSGRIPDGVPHMKYEVGLSVSPKGWHTGIDGLHIPWNDPDLPIMQWTGIVDKFDTDVYEDDFIEITWKDNDTTIERITWDDKYAYWKYGNNPLCEIIEDKNDFKVIGNTYSNPEYLNK